MRVWSGLLLASATTERFLCVAFPLRVKSWNLLFVTKFLMCLYAAVSVILGSIHAYSLQHVPVIGRDRSSCQANPYHLNLRKFTANVTFTFIANGICPCLIFVFTILIAIYLFKYKAQRRVLTHNSSMVESKEFTITLMLFIIACTDLVSRLFQMAVWHVRNYYQTRRWLTNETYINGTIIWPITNVLIVIKHSLNFFIYMVFFEKFRQTFKRYFACGCICRSAEISNVSGKSTISLPSVSRSIDTGPTEELQETDSPE